MKGLLHSKLFKKNLFKWIFMYVTVIGLFTTVVTYSKYITSMQDSDTARVAKFDASITYDGICTNINENEICNNGHFRPTSNISYYFTVDTTNLEVSTIFITRISVLEYFNNIKIYDVTDTETELTNFENENNVLTLTEELKVNETYIRKYKITMDFNHSQYDDNHSSEHLLNGAVMVGYSATQIK